MNRNRLVPLLEDDDFRLTEASAILVSAGIGFRRKCPSAGLLEELLQI